MKLTEEQSELVSENHNLIYWYANLAKLNLNDWYDLLAIELCYTVMKHDPSRGSLANYFKLRADGMVYKEYIKSQSQKRLVEEVAYVENVHGVPYYDKIEEGLEVSETMKTQYGDIIKLRYEGYTQSEIAVKLKLSQSNVSKVLKKVREEYDKNV